ncbi:hypothetical protein B7486_08160 [cyanobacterium TDX16]|nr:hypothetical protein B7486_08160 [cyanobacterium TDX16]
MFRKLLLLTVLLAACLSSPACAEKKVEERRADIEVNAPYARVRVNLPDKEKGKETHVDVDVDD